MPHSELTLIVDEIPGRIVGKDDELPGWLGLVDGAGAVQWEIRSLKMPYDAARKANGNYLVNLIRERAVWELNPAGAIVTVRKVGGYPCSLQLLAGEHMLVAGWDDDVPGFAREFDAAGRVVWSLENLRWPWKAERLANGNTLVADAGTGRVYEVNGEGKEVWSVDGLGPEEPRLFDALGPVYCQRLDNGNTLISIRGLSRIVEVNAHGQTVWAAGAPLVLNPYSVVRLPGGNTLIADQGHFRVIEINAALQVVWQCGGFGYPAKAYRMQS